GSLRDGRQRRGQPATPSRGAEEGPGHLWETPPGARTPPHPPPVERLRGVVPRLASGDLEPAADLGVAVDADDLLAAGARPALEAVGGAREVHPGTALVAHLAPQGGRGAGVALGVGAHVDLHLCEVPHAIVPAGGHVRVTPPQASGDADRWPVRVRLGRWSATGTHPWRRVLRS